MPIRLHKQLAKSAKQKGFKPGSERFNKYVYGTMAKIEKAKKKEKK